uniref:Uncharacterized protein n=1 Tax=Brassica campestris TaxID=3711 RepID=A0A3P6BH75_BRACM|nr:unnamed protein product [Brassica rapa]
MATRVESESERISAAVRSPSHRFRSNEVQISSAHYLTRYSTTSSPTFRPNTQSEPRSCPNDGSMYGAKPLVSPSIAAHRITLIP